MTGPTPTDRSNPGSKHHLLVDRQGIPLAVTLSAANVHDSQMLEATVDAVPPITRPRGCPRPRPVKLHADKRYEYAIRGQRLRRRSIVPRIARQGIESSARLGRHRWVVERALAGYPLAGVHRFRRLIIRYERRARSPPGLPLPRLRPQLLELRSGEVVVGTLKPEHL